jgi:chromosome segregation ATPase
MSEFLNGLREERQERESAAAALTAEKQDADEQLAHARAALAAWRDANREKLNRRGYLEPEAREEARLESDVHCASDRVEQIERGIKQAQQRIREIDQYLNAGKALDEARKAWKEGASKLIELRASAEKLDAFSASRRDQIADLEAKRDSALIQIGDAEVGDLLSGKPTPTARTAPVDHESDLAKLRAALTSAERRRAEVQASIDALLESSKQARQDLRIALQRRAELAYYEELPGFLPTIARVMAFGSWIGGGIGNLFSIRIDDELLRVATQEIEDEMRGEAA